LDYRRELTLLTEPQLNLSKAQKTILVGALIAVAFFLIVAGIAEIAITIDQDCRDSALSVRLSPDPFSVCMPEWEYYALRAVSRGFVWLFSPEAAPIFGWMVMALVYAILGGFYARTFRWQGVLAFIGSMLAIIAIVAGLGFMKRFIA
jgi:hypothetical protein